MRVAPVVAAIAAFVLSIPTAGQEDRDGKKDAPANPGAVRAVRVGNGDTVVIKVRISDRDRHIMTVLSLPDPVAKVISGWERDDLSLEHDGKKLFIKLLSKKEGHVDVITTTGKHVRFLVLPMPAPTPYDSHVVVAIRPGPEAVEKPAPPRRTSGALELVKAMRLGEVPPNATVRDGKKEVLDENDDVKITLLYVYETGRFRGTVLKLTNASLDEAYHVDVTRFTGDNLVLIGTRNMVVPGGLSTRIYVVDWK